MSILTLEDVPGWAGSETGIVAALRRMCEIMAPEGEESRLEELQAMADQLLDSCPAANAAVLEHRLGCLCRAVESLGPWANPSAIVDLAVSFTRRLH